MPPLARCSILASRAPRAYLFLRPVNQSIRLAHQSYGNEQSGHQSSDAANPKAHLEHPGPEPPAAKGKGSSSSSQQSSKSKSSDQKATSGDGSPKIYHPRSTAEQEDPEVRKHNEEMRTRHEQSVNQLSEKDNKVDPQYWQGEQRVLPFTRVAEH